MRILVVFIFLPYFQQLYSQPAFQLDTPLFKYQAAFFSGTTSFEVPFNQPHSIVHHTLNGFKPMKKDPVYFAPVKISKETVVKVSAFSQYFLLSATVGVYFMQDGKAIRRMEFLAPDVLNKSTNAEILYDNIGGITNLKSDTWLGYKSDTVTITIGPEKNEKLKHTLVDLLQDESSWIFTPEHVFVFCYDEKSAAFALISEHMNKQQMPLPKTNCNAWYSNQSNG